VWPRGCLPEATLLLEAIREPEAPLSMYSRESGLKYGVLLPLTSLMEY
jgi:hypothetical protein